MNRCLNFIKGMACMGVVLIHVAFPDMFGRVLVRMLGFAVPIFFLISGFYAYASQPEAIYKRFPGKIKRLLKLCAVVFPIYFVKNLLLHCIGKGTVSTFIALTINGASIKKMVFLNDFSTIIGSFVWFLPALLYCYGILYAAARTRQISWLYQLIPILFLLRVVVTGLPGFLWQFNSNFLLCGLPYFMSGMLLAKNKKEAGYWLRNRYLLGIVFFGLLFSGVGAVIIMEPNLFEFGTIAAALALFMLAIQNPQQYVCRGIERIGERYSAYVYMAHILVSNVIETAATLLDLDGRPWYSWSKPVCTILLTLCSGILFFRIIGKIKKKFTVST